MNNLPRVIMLLDNPLESDERVEKEARHLVKAGFTVRIFCLQSDYLDETEQRDGIDIIRMLPEAALHPYRSNYSNVIDQVVSHICREDFDILHCHDFHAIWIGSKVKQQRPQVFLTYDSHEYLRGWPYYKELKSSISRAKGYLVWKKLIAQEKVGIQSSDLIIAPSKSILAQQSKNASGKGMVVRNIPEKHSIAKNSSMLKEKGSRLKLLMVGNIYMSDSYLNEVVQYIESSEHFELLISGNRPIHERLQLVYRDFNHIHFTGYSASNNVTLAKSADIGIAYTNSKNYLAHRIGSSNRLMEYSLAGLPILGTNQESHRDFQSRYGHLVMFEDSSISSFIQRLNHLRENLEDYKSKAMAIKDLDWHLEFKPVIDYYRGLVASDI